MREEASSNSLLGGGLLNGRQFLTDERKPPEGGVGGLSAYWLQNPNPDLNDLFDLLKLQHAVANFVKIVSGRDIPVEFKSGNEKSTANKIIISADLSNIDATVGLAIHETLSFLYTTSWITSRLIGLVNDDYVRSFQPDTVKQTTQERVVAFSPLQKMKKRFITEIETIYRFIEYWRIDDLAIRLAPGYKGYIAEAYRCFFAPDETIKMFIALQAAFYAKSGIFNSQKEKKTWRDFIFEIPGITWNDAFFAIATQTVYSYNYVDVHTIPLDFQEDELSVLQEKLREKILGNDYDCETPKDLYALHKELKPIIDIDHISRLKSSEESLHLAIEVWETIKKAQNNLPAKIQYEEGTVNNPLGFEEPDLEKTVSRIIQAAGLEMDKKAISVSHKEQLKTLDCDFSNKNHTTYDNRRIQVVLLKGLNRDLVFCGRYTFFDTEHTFHNEQAVTDGIRLGKQLAQRLLFRNNERQTHFPRLQRGKIDKHLLHSVVCGNDAIFYREKEESFPAVNFHISIDGSHSMKGNCFWQSLKTAVAIAQAAYLIKNINVCISFRFHVNMEGAHLPLVLIAYDSRKDKISQIKQFFPFLKASGPTPEGLCYSVILDYMEKVAGEKSENYFINFYDGMPGFVIDDNCCYEGKAAMEHVRDEVFRMKRKGIRVLSYYIVSEKWRAGSVKSVFADCQYMYGKEAKMININDLGELAQSLNRLVAG